MPHLSREAGASVLSPEELGRLYKRTLVIVVVSQIFGGAGLAAGVTVGALLAQEMLGTDSLTGLPAALLTLGSAGAAFVVGRLSQRFGRRPGLAAGFITGGIGAAGIVLAAIVDSISLFFVSLFIYGAGSAANLQARYAGTDLAKPKQRATAVSIAMVSTTFGAVAGPNLVDATGRFAASIGISPLAGPFLLAAAAYMLAGLALLILLRPDPLAIARAVEKERISRAAPGGDAAAADTASTAANRRGIVVGAAVMIMTQIVMVAIMTMTPIHMKHHGHGLGEVGFVIGVHIGAMYLPSLVTGILIDKIGRTAMSLAAGGILLSAGIVAAFAPADSMPALAAALALLGLGWNLGLIGGTALVVDATRPDTRAKTQGSIDVLVALAGASGGAVSGVVAAHASYAALALAGGCLSLLLIPVVVWSRGGRKAAMAEGKSLHS